MEQQVEFAAYRFEQLPAAAAAAAGALNLDFDGDL
jgi:hypothetical protein